MTLCCSFLEFSLYEINKRTNLFQVLFFKFVSQNLKTNLRKIAVLTIFSSPIHNNGMPLRLIGSLISFTIFCSLQCTCLVLIFVKFIFKNFFSLWHYNGWNCLLNFNFGLFIEGYMNTTDLGILIHRKYIIPKDLWNTKSGLLNTL